MYTLILRPRAARQFRKLSRRDKERVAQVIDRIAEDPFSGKKLEGDLHGFYVVRVWPYRVIYTVEKRIVTVTIVAIGHRKEVYEKLRN